MGCVWCGMVGQECLIEVPQVQCIELIREVPKEVPNTEGWGSGKGGGNTCFLFFGGVGGGDVDEYVSFLNDITLLFFIVTIIIVDLFVQ